MIESTPITSLHIIFSLDGKLGGAVHAALGVAAYLNSAGHRAEVLASYLPTDSIDYLKTAYAKVPCHLVARTFPQRYYFAARLKAWICEHANRFDIVEIHGVWNGASYAAWQACIELKKPFFVRPHGSLDPFDLRKRSLLKSVVGPLYIKRLLNESSGVLLTAQLEADRLVSYGGNPRKYSVALPIPAGARTPENARQHFRRQQGIAEDAFVVLFLSRIDYKKGLEFLIPSLAKLKKAHPRLVFLMVGSGHAAYVQTVKSLLADHGVAEWTVQPGFLSGEDKQSALAASDIFALPSLNENFGIVIVEAMRAGLPVVVSTEVYIHKEIVEAGAGYACDPAIFSCHDALKALLCMKDQQRLTMGENGRNAVLHTFSPEAATKKLLEVYRSVLEAQTFRAGGLTSLARITQHTEKIV